MAMHSKSTTPTARQRRRQRRFGKVLILLAIMLPTLCGLIGLVVDGGLLLASSRQAQHAADSAATSAAMEKQHGQSNGAALAAATQTVQQHNLLAGANVSLQCPPTSGPYAGSSNHVEVIVSDECQTYFMHLLGGAVAREISVRSVAGFEPSTAGSAIVVLDPDPPPFETAPLPGIPALGALPSLPAILGGLEVLGLGVVDIDGAVLVNTTWGGLDENGNQVGEPHGLLNLSHGVSATPLLGLSRLRTRDLRVVGGVDNPAYYGPLSSGGPQPLQAGRLPVPDPFKDLPVPTTDSDPLNVNTTLRGNRTVIGLPLIGPPVTLQPGL